VTWALFALSQAPKVQSRLRDEVLAVHTEHPSMDELNALPYLDCVIKETMRVHAPVPSSIRTTGPADIWVPLGTPVEDKHGNMIDGIKYVGL
jgi:cytochrome P450